MQLSKAEGLEITAKYYDKDGNLIGTSEDSKGIFSTQAIYSPGVTQVPAETVNIILNIGITNTGNILIDYELLQILLNSVQYSATVSEGTIEVGQQIIIQSDPIDVSSIVGENQIEIQIDIYEHPYQTGDLVISESYYWQFNMVPPIVVFRSNVIGSQYAENTWIAIDENDDGNLSSFEYEGRFLYTCYEYYSTQTVIGQTPEGYIITKYADPLVGPRRVFIEKGDGTCPKYVIGGIAELSSIPIEPYTTNQQEICFDGSIYYNCGDISKTPILWI